MDTTRSHASFHAGRMARTLALALVALTLVAGCTSAATDAAPAVALDASTVLIDVRTPEEYASGHLEGAVNLPVEWDGFPAAVERLDPDLTYVLYCRSGRRSAIAADAMTAAWLEVVDLGAFDAARTATMLAVVTP